MCVCVCVRVLVMVGCVAILKPCVISSGGSAVAWSAILVASVLSFCHTPQGTQVVYLAPCTCMYNLH